MEKKNNNQFHEFILGVDLGTTNTVMAVIDPSGIPKVLPNLAGNLVTPSSVSVASKPPLVGKLAKPDKILNPELVAEQFKKLMDRVAEEGDSIPLLVAPDKTEYTPPMLSAEVLHYEKRSAEKILGCSITKAVIGVPAYFRYRARQATKDAALIAGFEEVLIVDEPTAAATHYGLEKMGKNNEKVAVLDFGGGTFDVSILDVKSTGQIDPVAVDGDPECGGSNIDEILFVKAQDTFAKKGHPLNPSEDLATWYEVLDYCEKAKENLAWTDAAVVPLRIGEERTSIEFTYDELERCSAPIIEVLRNCCLRALEKARIKAKEIDKVVLVGGSTRLRFVPKLAEDIFGQKPKTDADPDMVIALGCAIIGAAHFGKSTDAINIGGHVYLPSAIKSTQIAARDLCVAAVMKKDQGDNREYNVALIPAGAKLPFEAKQVFTPIKPGASAVAVKLIDGKPDDLSSNYTPLEQVEVQVQPTDEANNEDRIEFTTKMDIEALVHISVRDKLLNKPVPIKFTFHAGLLDRDLDEQRQKLIARHKDDDQLNTEQKGKRS